MALRYLISVFIIFILFFLRNICRVGLTLVLAVLARLIESPEDLPRSLLAETHSDLREAASMPLVCEILSMTDHVLMTVLMFYLSALSLYLFCRQPNPPVLASSLKTLRVRTYRIHSVLRVMFSCTVSHRAFCLFRRGGGYVLFFFSFPLSWLFVSVSLFSFSTCPTPSWWCCALELNTYLSMVAILRFCLSVAIIIGTSVRRSSGHRSDVAVRAVDCWIFEVLIEGMVE